MTATAPAPRWNTESLFPSLGSPEFQAAFAEVLGGVGELQATFDALDIRKGGRQPDLAAAFERVTGEMNLLYERLRTVGAYIQAFVTTDSANDLAQARQSELGTRTAALGQLNTRFEAWIGGLDLEALLAQSETARRLEYVLRKDAAHAEHQMPAGEEELANLLRLSGAGAWAKLHGNLTSALTVPWRGETLPMTAVRNLSGDPDPAVREEAYRAELAAWQGVEVPLAAAMNGIKGEVNTLNARRGWPDAVAPTLLSGSIDAETLEAMQRAVTASFPDFRRYFRAKGRLLGHAGALPWWDLFAPTGHSDTRWTWGEAQRFVEGQFRAYSPRLGDLAARAFREGWIDAPPRPGKRGGAFCMGVRPGESRILMNFDENLDSVSTLAHELGHAYHNLCLQSRPPLERGYPMTLAETASIFCETLTVGAALEQAEGAEKLSILETQLIGHAQVVVDIHSRFLFERAVFEKRAERDLSPRELSELMLWAQRETYGDGLTDDLHPYMWAVKPHYYGSSFYNYPYTFGLLFGLGLYARYQQDPEGFRAGYDDLLADAGLYDAATLAARFGIDTRDEGFWTGSLDVIRGHITDYEALAQG